MLFWVPANCINIRIFDQLNNLFFYVCFIKILTIFLGDFAGYDESEPTSQTGGKIKVVHQLKQKFGYTNLVMIGDGMTDLETCPPADAFIGDY